MPKLPVLSPKRIVKILEQKGFELNRIKGSHHIFIRPSDKRVVVVPFHKTSYYCILDKMFIMLVIPKYESIFKPKRYESIFFSSSNFIRKTIRLL